MGQAKPIVTPVGELHFVNIKGQGKQNYNEDGYNYVATVNLTGDAAETLKAAINEELGEVPKGKNVKSLGFRELLKDEEGMFAPTANNKERQENAEPTGITAFTFTTGTTFADGKQKVISVYNSSKPPTRINIGDKKIGNGSKGAISGKIQRFERGKDVGVSLFLNAVQLVDFIEYAGDAGFESQEGGYTGDDDGFTSSSPENEAAKSDTQQTAAKPKVKL